MSKLIGVHSSAPDVDWIDIYIYDDRIEVWGKKALIHEYDLYEYNELKKVAIIVNTVALIMGYKATGYASIINKRFNIDTMEWESYEPDRSTNG